MPTRRLQKAVPLVFSVLGLLEGVLLLISRLTIDIQQLFLSVLDFHVTEGNFIRIRSSFCVLHFGATETIIVLITFR